MISNTSAPANTHKKQNNQQNREYRVLGMMSGTSLDGLDLAFCRIRVQQDSYSFQIDQASTIPYSPAWQERLAGLVDASGLELSHAHAELGTYFGRQARGFLDKNNLEAELIASHGHTIFHQPEKGFSLQIGQGQQLMIASGCRVVNDFRSLDIALGGQGAPLVPIGDELLFGQYPFCLNIGGIANVSARHEGQRIAYDICPANMVLNKLSRQTGRDYDEGGKLAASGNLHRPLLEELEQLDYYRQPFPKSLGYEWVAEKIFPMLEKYALPVADLLHTFCHHIAQQLRHALAPLATTSGAKGKPINMLISGGGAYNHFLVELMGRELSPLGIEIIVPEKKLIEYKEALVFALLGVLRLRESPNSLASVSGASRNSCGGVLHELL